MVQILKFRNLFHLDFLIFLILQILLSARHKMIKLGANIVDMDYADYIPLFSVYFSIYLSSIISARERREPLKRA